VRTDIAQICTMSQKDAAKIANLRDGQRKDYADAQNCAPISQLAAAEILNISRRSAVWEKGINGRCGCDATERRTD